MSRAAINQTLIYLAAVTVFVFSAGRQRFRYITFPQIKPVVVILLVYNVLVGVTSFDVTYALTAGGPGTATILLSFNIWRESFSSLNFGTGSAVAFIVVLISIGLLIGILKALPADLFGARQR